jgi:broad-specificity NMP kinase
MGVYLVTGRAGSGKSTICLELTRRGLPAYDGDRIPGLASWISLETGLHVAINPAEFVDYKKVGWDWDENVLQTFIDNNKTCFVCGSASNQSLLYKKFDKVFVLTLKPETQRSRLITRTNSSYAKHPNQIKEILEEQQVLVEKSKLFGAILIDAEQTPSKVADEILGNIL